MRFSKTYRSLLTFSVLVIGSSSFAFGQSGTGKDVNVVNVPSVNVANTPTVGIDPAKNTVKLDNNESNPLAVKVTGGAVRQPFQAGINLDILAGGNSDIEDIDIPAGKRLVIESVNAVTFQPPGQGLLITFQTALSDQVGDNAGSIGFEDFDLVLTSQGIFNGSERSTANHKVLAFADETVTTTSGTVHGRKLSVHMARGTTTGTAGARVTFSGYLEDLP